MFEQFKSANSSRGPPNDGGRYEKEEFLKTTSELLNSLSAPELNPRISPEEAYDQAQEDLYRRRGEWDKFKGYGRSKKILVVVQDQFDRNTLSRFFRTQGFQVVSAYNAQDGWEKFLEAKNYNSTFDLVAIEETKSFSPAASMLVRQINKEALIILVLEDVFSQEAASLARAGFITQIVDKVALDTGIAIVYKFPDYLKEKYDLDKSAKQGARGIFRIPAECLSFSSSYQRWALENGLRFQVGVADPGFKHQHPSPDILSATEVGMNDLINRFNRWVNDLGVKIAEKYQSRHKKDDLEFIIEEALKNSWDAIVSFFDPALESFKAKDYLGSIDILVKLEDFQGQEVIYIEVNDNGEGIESANTEHKRVSVNCGSYKHYWGQKGQGCIRSQEIVRDLWERLEFGGKLDGGTEISRLADWKCTREKLVAVSGVKRKISLIGKAAMARLPKFYWAKIMKKKYSGKKKAASGGGDRQDIQKKNPEKTEVSLELNNALNGLEFGSGIAQKITNQVSSAQMVNSFI